MSLAKNELTMMDAPVAETAAIASPRRVSTTPWAVFVHASPVYVTSDTPSRLRRGRPTTHRNGAPNRRGMRLPDDYPYANRRWSERLRALRAVRHDVGDFS